MLKKLSRITTIMCAVITTFSLFLLVVLVSVQILTRYVAESPLIWTEEAARYTLILLTMLGAAWLGSTDEHIGLGLGVGPAKTRPKANLDLAVRAVSVITLVGLAVLGFASVENFAGSSSAMRIPNWIVYATFPLGSALWAFHSAVVLVERWSGFRNPESEVSADDAETSQPVSDVPGIDTGLEGGSTGPSTTGEEEQSK